jgi:putative membrane protein
MSTATQPKIDQQQSSSKYVLFLLAAFTIVFAWSAIRPHDYFTWFLEVVPAIVGLAVLGATSGRLRFTPLVYTLLLLHAIILMVGGHYTYAEVPLGNWVRDAFHLGRNHYDRLGHFAQGFVPALVAREVLIRKKVVKRGWLYFIVFSICMMVTACYELFEFAVAKWTGTAADAFLGSQGDPWDTQWDMTLCLIGCNVALLTMAWWQDRQIEKVQGCQDRELAKITVSI